MDIYVRFRQGQIIRHVARELGISRNTVRKYLNQQHIPIYKTRQQKILKLSQFKSYLHSRIEMANLATVLFASHVLQLNGDSYRLKDKMRSGSIPE